MNEALTLLREFAPYIGIGAAITVITQVLKRLASLEKDGYIRLLFHAVTVATTVVTYLLGAHGLSAFTVLLHGSAYSGLANGLYPLVKKADRVLGKVQVSLKDAETDIPKVESAVNTASVDLAAAPATPPPVAGTPQTIEL